MSKIKQVLVMREDLGMSAGKLAAQTAHASVGARYGADRNHEEEWRRTGTTKIVLGAGSEAEIVDIYKQAVASYLTNYLVADEGRTEVDPGTITGVGIGPAPSEKIDQITRHLKLYGYAPETGRVQRLPFEG